MPGVIMRLLLPHDVHARLCNAAMGATLQWQMLSVFHASADPLMSSNDWRFSGGAQRRPLQARVGRIPSSQDHLESVR